MPESCTLDADVLAMSTEELLWEVLGWRAAVREHRQWHKDGPVWHNDQKLYEKLPEGFYTKVK